ncbi:uncharacterized protein LOC114358505 [Ostrinia furnacalis]|uniref:uncharacterized protein LOC114358505 n=1 Tax=Ostrinia furnacalis TaxID=93504 RepID=UPI00103FD8F0|nr:uncharacterized protein LOC114358505 [Ostrinia furnacalis]
MIHCFNKTNNLRLISITVLCLGSAICYPISKVDPGSKLDKSEKHFPNGTVVGKYSYTDNEGNPIQVKYYADNSSYGVELKSLKMVTSTGAPLDQTYKQPVIDNLLQNADASLGLAADFYNPTNIKYKINDPFEILKKDNVKHINQFKDIKTSPDYEIYFQNELKAPKKCGKEKVRVYFDKDKRTIREASSKGFEDTAKICSRF